ncbi:MAG: hypothetical protein J6U86_04420 [Clostridia bacterium]|nr:hypothetical protein [Clostridia bacterium]
MNPFKTLIKHAPLPGSRTIQKEESEDIKESGTVVDEKRIGEWIATLRRYKSAKATIEQKLKSNERFWRMRQWKEGAPEDKNGIPATAWLFTCIQSKLADAVEAYPRANFRPRQRDDAEEARMLSSVCPIIVDQTGFRKTYKNVAEYTLKNGVGVYHIWWDGAKHNGLGDIAISEQNVLNIFWEPGITDIQRSTYVFTVEVVDISILRHRYPEQAPRIKSKVIDVSRFITDERVDTHDKVVVVDVYYKVNGALHYAKIADNVLLESTENCPERYPYGLYKHGKYPFVVQQLYHIEQSLYGTGLVDIGADAQIQIDLINEAVVENTLMGAKPRYFSQVGNNFRDEDLLDWRKAIVPCASISDTALKPIESKSLQGNYLDFLNMKTQELKFVTSNQDINNGMAPSGITAASALAVLQEGAGRSSRFINRTFYDAFLEVMEFVVELMREFYNTQRWFRVASDEMGGEEDFVRYDNTALKGAVQLLENGTQAYRVPEFDIEITAERASPYKKMEMNELALTFFKMGFFTPQMTDQAIACLSIMDFDGKEEIMDTIRQNGVLADRVQMLQELGIALAAKYKDAEAMMALQQSLGGGAQSIPSADVDIHSAVAPDKGAGEIKQVERARAMARSNIEV